MIDSTNAVLSIITNIEENLEVARSIDARNKSCIAITSRPFIAMVEDRLESCLFTDSEGMIRIFGNPCNALRIDREDFNRLYLASKTKGITITRIGADEAISQYVDLLESNLSTFKKMIAED